MCQTCSVAFPIFNKQLIGIQPMLWLTLVWPTLTSWSGRRARFPAREGFPKAKAAALAALELDDSLGAAHASLAHIYFDYDWTWTDAEAEYKKAIALGPNYSIAHLFLWNFLVGDGQKHRSVR
jgi:hypothetical protein